MTLEMLRRRNYVIHEFENHIRKISLSNEMWTTVVGSHIHFLGMMFVFGRKVHRALRLRNIPAEEKFTRGQNGNYGMRKYKIIIIIVYTEHSS